MRVEGKAQNYSLVSLKKSHVLLLSCRSEPPTDFIGHIQLIAISLLTLLVFFLVLLTKPVNHSKDNFLKNKTQK